MYIYIPLLYIHNIPRYTLKIMEKLISRNTSQQLLQRLQLLVFSSIFNNVNKPGISFVNF